METSWALDLLLPLPELRLSQPRAEGTLSQAQRVQSTSEPPRAIVEAWWDGIAFHAGPDPTNVPLSPFLPTQMLRDAATAFLPLPGLRGPAQG